MLYIVWNAGNELGIPIIDEQHRGIVSTINSFHHFIREGQGLDALQPTLNILEQYTFVHFKTEEALFTKAEYPDTDKHIQLHDKLMHQTRDIAHESVTHREPEVALKFLKEWWLSHINDEDRQYCPAVKRHLGYKEDCGH